MSASGTWRSNHAPALEKTARVRRPLGTLLHALNQPLTGLQCSMEVALASPRTPDQYVHGLREGLELTERMRALVEAIREVVDMDDDLEEERKEEKQRRREGEEEERKDDKKKEGRTKEGREATELKTVLRESLDDLAPVGEVKHVRVRFECAACALTVKAPRRGLSTAIFRLLESALSLAVRGTVMQVEAGETPGETRSGLPEKIWMRVQWQAQPQVPAFSRPELGLIVAQAGFECSRGEWERERSKNQEGVTVWWPKVGESSG